MFLLCQSMLVIYLSKALYLSIYTYMFIDLDMERLEVAKKCGADHVLQVKTTDSKQLAQDITDLLGYKPDQTIECTGAKTAIATGIYVHVVLLQVFYLILIL